MVGAAAERLRTRLRARPGTVYGLAHCGKSVLWSVSALYFAFFLTEVVGVPATRMGLILAASLLFNALCDLVIGRILARHVQDTCAAARLQARGAAVASTGFILFACTSNLPASVGQAYSLATVLLFRLGYSMMDVPQNSFMAFLATTDRERADLAATRYIAAGVSVLLVTLVLSPLVQVADPADQAHLFLLLSVAMALTTASSGWLLGFVFASEKANPDPRAAAISSVGEDAAARTYPLLLLAILLFSSMASIFSKLESYLTAYVLDGSAADLFLPTLAIGQIGGQFVWKRVANRLGLQGVLILACCAWLVSTGLFWASLRLAPLGVLPATFVYAAAWGGVPMALWGLLASSCSAVPHLTTRRYGMFTCVSKIAQAAAILLIGGLLAGFDYQAEAGMERLVATMIVGPLAGSVLIALVGVTLRRSARQAT